MSWIKCECGKEFLGQEDKEDTCPDCLKKLINPRHFKKGQLTKESYKVIMRDIQLLKDNQKQEDFIYYYDLVIKNLNDIWGLK